LYKREKWPESLNPTEKATLATDLRVVVNTSRAMSRRISHIHLTGVVPISAKTRYKARRDIPNLSASSPGDRAALPAFLINPALN